MDISNMTMVPGDVRPGEKSRYYVWLPEGRDVGAPFREFDPIPLEAGVLSRLKAPTDVYLCYDEEDKDRIPQVGEIRDEVNVHKEDPARVRVDLEQNVLNYNGVDMEGANWLLLVWR